MANLDSCFLYYGRHWHAALHEVLQVHWTDMPILACALFPQGAPLAYTPFCDNNRDMDGFRFWKQGFWKDHLRGRPYHISALYVVDLARFRCPA